ncbi:MAG: hypothetical protein JWM77_1440 [Rhodospirillales bacterium]|nr:hypothetical protein [Rhodospirillales bacterium]
MAAKPTVTQEEKMRSVFLPSRVSAVETPLGALQREADRLVADFERALPLPRAAALVPRVDVEVTDQNVVVTAELPGLEAKDVDIRLRDDVLVIQGEKQEKREDKEGSMQRIERRYGTFTRVIELPVEVSPEQVEASFENGVLRIELKRATKDDGRTRKIEVKSSSGTAGGNGKTSNGGSAATERTQAA